MGLVARQVRWRAESAPLLERLASRWAVCERTSALRHTPPFTVTLMARDCCKHYTTGWQISGARVAWADQLEGARERARTRSVRSRCAGPAAHGISRLSRAAVTDIAAGVLRRWLSHRSTVGYGYRVSACATATAATACSADAASGRRAAHASRQA